MASINFQFRAELLHTHGAFSLSGCYQCATCTGSCPVAKETNGHYNPRRIIERALLGMKENLINDPSIWLCTMCDTCDEVCPQNVVLTEIFTVIKNLAVKEGNVPQRYKEQSTSVWETGVSVPFMDAILRRRRDLGLEQNLDENVVIPLQELQTLMEATGFKDIIHGFKKAEAEVGAVEASKQAGE
ncbi:MAG: 4Fe-4S dicluster domain-containing protein [Promethearchaeota archaeon]